MTSPTATAILAAINTVGLCTCRTYPATHRADLHDHDGQVTDIEMTPTSGWADLQRATCLRCGWQSEQTWFAEGFRRPSAQTYIAGHRDRWTGECLTNPARKPW